MTTSQLYRVKSVSSIRCNSVGNPHLHHQHETSQRSNSLIKIMHRSCMEKRSMRYRRPENPTKFKNVKFSTNEKNLNWPQGVQGFAIKPHIK